MDEVRAFLESARDSALKCADLRERVARLDTQARRITPTLSPTAGVSGGGGNQKDSLLIALAEAREEIAKDIATELQLQKEISDFIDRLDTSDVGKAVLRRRYIHYESWIRVIRWLSDHNLDYAESSVYRLHGEALDAARRLWAKEHPTPERKGERT